MAECPACLDTGEVGEGGECHCAIPVSTGDLLAILCKLEDFDEPSTQEMSEIMARLNQKLERKTRPEMTT